MRVYKEITDDQGRILIGRAKNNAAGYVMTSAHMKDSYRDYYYTYGREPSSSWYHRRARFYRAKDESYNNLIRGVL